MALEKKKKRWEIEGNGVWPFHFLLGILLSSPCSASFFAGFYVFPWSFLFFSFGTLFSTRCSYIIPPQQLPRYWEKNGFSIDIPLWWFNSHWPGLKLGSLLFWVFFLFSYSLSSTSMFPLYLSIPLLVYTLHFCVTCSPWAILFEYVPDMMCVRCLIQRYIYGSFYGPQSIIWYSIFKVLRHFSFIRQMYGCGYPRNCFAGMAPIECHRNLNFLCKSSCYHMYSNLGRKVSVPKVPKERWLNHTFIYIDMAWSRVFLVLVCSSFFFNGRWTCVVAMRVWHDSLAFFGRPHSLYNIYCICRWPNTKLFGIYLI